MWSVTLTLRAMFLPIAGLTNGSSSDESNLVKTASKRQRMSEGLLSLDGPRLLASPTRAPRRHIENLSTLAAPAADVAPASKHRLFAWTLTSEQIGIPRP